jgi:hypothetical protein
VSISGGGQALKEKTAKQLADAMEAMLEANNMSANEIFEVMLGPSFSKKFRQMARIGYKAGWMHLLRSQPEPSKAQVNETLAMLEGFKNVRHRMRSLLKQTVDKLPHAPGGPPRKIKPEEEKIVCTEINSIRFEHDTREAIRRVAAKRGVSERTIYRIWGKYNPKKKKKGAVQE